MTISVVSTTDTPEAVTAAIGGAAPKEEKTPETTPAPVLEKDTEQKPTSDSEPDETETEETDAAEADAKDASTKDKPKNKGGFQRRIDKLNAKKADAEREQSANVAERPAPPRHAPERLAAGEFGQECRAQVLAAAVKIIRRDDQNAREPQVAGAGPRARRGLV